MKNFDMFLTNPDLCDEIVKKVISFYPDCQSKQILEPCVGTGNFVKAFLDNGFQADKIFINDIQQVSAVKQKFNLPDGNCTVLSGLDIKYPQMVITNPPFTINKKTSYHKFIQKCQKECDIYAFVVPYKFFMQSSHAKQVLDMNIKYIKFIDCNKNFFNVKIDELCYFIAQKDKLDKKDLIVSDVPQNFPFSWKPQVKKYNIIMQPALKNSQLQTAGKYVVYCGVIECVCSKCGQVIAYKKAFTDQEVKFINKYKVLIPQFIKNQTKDGFYIIGPNEVPGPQYLYIWCDTIEEANVALADCQNKLINLQMLRFDKSLLQ